VRSFVEIFRQRGILTGAIAASLLGVTACADWSGPKTGQGWSEEEQAKWYAATQGSRLIPLDWLNALEQAGNTELFLARGNIERFRLLSRPSSALPVGFAVDDNDDTNLNVSKLQWFVGQGSTEKWVGLNCAACHTGEISYSGKQLRIDGGPSLFDFQLFVEELDQALHAVRDSAAGTTPDQQAKWRRFSKAVLGPRPDRPDSDNDLNRGKLLAALDKLIAWEDRVETMNRTPLRYGYGRVDAFGHIFNKTALFTGAAQPTANPADAPVSYPFLWDIYRHDKLQWNGIVNNQRIHIGAGYIDVGALGRNTGEVLGVFGDVVVKPNAGLAGYRSSVWADNLISLETQLSTLKPPPWPADLLGAIGDTTRGKDLFDQHCASCHRPQPGVEPYKVTMVPLKQDSPNSTDPWMACNAITYRSITGQLEGTPKGYIGGDRYGRDALLADMLETTVKGTLVGKKGQVIAQAGRVFIGVGRPPRVVTEEVPDFQQLILDECFKSGSPLMAYKARPLDGIWATAPYLHNGSVPTLAALLMPAKDRPKSFRVGTRVYDPKDVGYSTDPNAPGNSFPFDTALRGNSNLGHEYGVSDLTDPNDRLALLQYLKSL
jgi:hypothetical protein